MSNAINWFEISSADFTRATGFYEQVFCAKFQRFDMDGVEEVFSVAGRFDLVAVVKVAKNECLADVISHQMRRLDGIVETETMIAFRAYSKQELEAGFELGLD